MAHGNVVTILGNLCKDPNLRFTPSGKAICDLVVAVNRTSGSADYIPVIVWGKDAEACDKYIKKGSLVFVTGRISSRNYTKPDGSKHVAIEIVSSQIEFLDREKLEKSNEVEAVQQDY